MVIKLPLISLILFPETVQACSVCFGGANENLQKGFYWGILILLLLPLLLFFGIGGKIVLASRKKE